MKRDYVAQMPFAVRNVEGVKKLLARPAIVHRWWGDLYFALEDGPEQIRRPPSSDRPSSRSCHGRSSGIELCSKSASRRRRCCRGCPAEHHARRLSCYGRADRYSDRRRAAERGCPVRSLPDNPIGDSSPESSCRRNLDHLPFAIAFTEMMPTRRARSSMCATLSRRLRRRTRSRSARVRLRFSLVWIEHPIPRSAACCRCAAG